MDITSIYDYKESNFFQNYTPIYPKSENGSITERGSKLDRKVNYLSSV